MSVDNVEQSSRLSPQQSSEKRPVDQLLNISRQTSLGSERDMTSVELESLQTVRDSPVGPSRGLQSLGSAPPNATEPSHLSSEQLILPGSTSSKATIERDDDPSLASKMHSRAVVVMVTAFVIGSAISLGHHFYYLRLNG